MKKNAQKFTTYSISIDRLKSHKHFNRKDKYTMVG